MNAKALSQDLCFLNNYPDTSCFALSVDVNVLKTSFNHEYDTTDYFSSRELNSIQMIRYDTMSALRVRGKDTVLNTGEIILLLSYRNDSMAKIAFKNLLYHIEYPGSNNFFLFIKMGIVLGVKENQIALYHPNDTPNDNPYATKKNLIDISSRYQECGYQDIYFVNGRLVKFK